MPIITTKCYLATYEKNARTVRNPKTGQTLQMNEHYSPKFQPKSIYKQTIKSVVIQKENEIKPNV